MTDQTAASLSTSRGGQPIPVTPHDRDVLRRLAAEVAELAARPIEQDKRELWYRHNALQPTRPLIFCDPENGWNEIITQDQVECSGDLARAWEYRLRKEIFWGAQMRDDRVIEPCFDIRHVYSESGWGMHETRVSGGPGGSYVWDAPVKSHDDLARLRRPEIIVDQDATQRLLDLAHEVLEDLLQVRLKTTWWWSLGMTWTLISLRGLEQMMLDMTDDPRMLHELMTFLRDGHMAKLETLESSGLLSLNNDGSYVGSGGFGWSRELPSPGFDGTVRTADLWGFAESQETVGVSPKMFEEFVFPYQLTLLERFGLNCYGCCEPVDGRWDVVKRIPRLRRVSVSAWCNLQRTAGLLGSSYIFSWKPNPADLAAPSFDRDRIRRQLREGIRTTRDCRLEIIMKDNHTIGGDPSRVTEWVRIAKEEAESA